MAESQDLIDFEVIESHKENIQALPSGRSAKALAQLYSPPLLGATPSPLLTDDVHSKTRAAYERELANIDEADDPLDVYDRYVKWTLDAYPSAQATPQSQLLPLLERATKAFQSSTHYKNDPRYLRIWLHYIRFFSDAPREVFVFLSRHNIGDGLALYFEEFAAWLENAGRWNQAEEIYKMGLEKEARPVERLLRKFGEFEKRKEARSVDAVEPSSPALPAVRPALAAKLDPFAASSPSSAPQSSSGAAKKPKSSKMAIFSDSEAPTRPDSGSSTKGWDSIGSLADRKKENSSVAKPWAGETLKGGKTNGGVPKMMVFKDQVSHYCRNSSSQEASMTMNIYECRTKSSLFCIQSSQRASIPKHFNPYRSSSSSTHQQQCVRNPKTGRLECVFVNLEAVYPDVGNMSVEYCFEELRARHRGLSGRSQRNSQNAVPTKVEDSNDTLAINLVDIGHAKSNQRTSVPVEESAKPKPKERGFKIFEDPTPGKQPLVETPLTGDQIMVESSMKTLALNDENDENALPSDRATSSKPAKKAKKDDRGNRTRKIKLIEKHIKSETKTIQINLNSPTGPKTVKRKKSSSAAVERTEPTMTINTKEAMDEIYGIFAQPMQSQAEQTDQEEDEDESESSSEEEADDDDDDFTTDGESTATGKLSAPASEYGDETRNEILKIRNGESSKHGANLDDEDHTDNTGWSDFTMNKPAPPDGSGDAPSEDHLLDADDEPLATPIDNDDPHTLYMNADYVPALPNHRLPFMTPIVEQTESSLGAGTIRMDKHAYAMKTPSRKAGNGIADLLGRDEDDDICSSPFDEVTLDREDIDDEEDDDDENIPILQPIRTKSTKGTLSLGQGSAKAQTTARTQPSAGTEDPHAVQKGPIITENQCNPMDPELRATILAQMKPALSTFEGYHEDLSAVSGRSAEIKKFVRAQSKAGKVSSGSTTANTAENKTASSLAIPPVINLPSSYSKYTIKRELGAGTFAPVYLAENFTAAALDAEEEEAIKSGNQEDQVSISRLRLGRAAHRRALEAIKMEAPPSVWEFYMLGQSHRRLGSERATQSIVRAHEMHLFQDECFLIEEYRSQGTLLDLVNLAREDAPSGGMDEALAMWCTIELLRTVEALHARGLIHGDLKADNILVRLDDPGMETDWSPTYWANGAHGWDSKGVCLIDFGRGIDMRHFKPDVGFLADWKTTDADCSEMRELRPWTYQIDYYGLAGIIHSLLFGKYMETINDKASGGPGAATAVGAAAAKSYRIRETLKRYWQTEIWASAFDLLLNPLSHLEQEDGRRMPVLSGMRECRERMESWLEENCERGNGLRNTILRMEALIRERKRKVKA
jgi:checkpoint serine/threonine-protein kinase